MALLFCSNTAQDPFGRVESQYTVSGKSLIPLSKGLASYKA